MARLRRLAGVVLAATVWGCSGSPATPSEPNDVVDHVDETAISGVVHDADDVGDGVTDPLRPLGPAMLLDSGSELMLSLRGTRGAACASGTLRLFDVEDGAGVSALPLSEHACAAVAMLDDVVIVVRHDGSIARADWPAASAELTLDGVSGQVAGGVSVASDGTTAAVAVGNTVRLVGAHGTPIELEPKLDSQVRAVALSDQLVVTAGDDGLLSVLDRTGALLGVTPLEGPALAVTLTGDRAYVAEGSAGLEIIDISEPSAPVALIAHDLGGLVLDVASTGERTIVAANYSSLLHVELEDDHAPVILGRERRARAEDGTGVGAVRAVPVLRVAADAGVVVAAFTTELAALEIGAGGPDLSLDTPFLSLPHVEAGEVEHFAVVIRNIGLTDLRIDLPEAALGPFLLDLAPFGDGPMVIPGGGAGAVEGTYTAVDTQPVQATLVLHSNDPDEPEVSLALLANHPSLQVGDVAPLDVAAALGDGTRTSLEEHSGKVILLKLFNFL